MPDITPEEVLFFNQHIAAAMGPKTGRLSSPPSEKVVTEAVEARLSRKFWEFRETKIYPEL
jgi:hypothetical protein